MKIIGIGRNYAAHIKELNNEIPENPLIFFMPDTALLRNNDDFYYPEFSNNIHYEIEVVVRISVVGKNIVEKFAHKYYDAIALGIDFTARDLQNIAMEKGLPWTIAKGFNHSAPISQYVSKEKFNDLQNLDFSLTVNGETKQKGNTKMMMRSIDQIIEYVSRFITLKKGDLIFTGTPEGVGPVKVGDRMVGYLEGKKMFDFSVK